MADFLIDVVSATRRSRDDFWTHSALGCSLKRFSQDPRIICHIEYENRCGLPEIYNRAIHSDSPADMLVFIHDDVWLEDLFWVERVAEACHRYDVVGLAGNTSRGPMQPAWCFVWGEHEGVFQLDDIRHLSGSIAHGKERGGSITKLGAAGVACELIDGVFIAARKAALLNRNVAFDPRFKFHFYDLDFCREVRSKGMTIGTWPISVTHQSEGAFGSAVWWQGYRDYIGKWGS